MKLKPKLFHLALSVLAVSPLAHGATPAEVRSITPQPLEFHLFNEVTEAIVPPEPDVEIYSAGAHYFKKAITSTKPRVSSSETFIKLPGAATKVVIPAGQNALVNVAFSAESRCAEADSSAPNWCEMRILVDGTEASPAASTFGPDTYAFDSTDRGSETLASWESHAMDRHQCIFNSHSTTSKTVPIEVQWKVTNFDGGVAPAFWLDDWSVTVELAKGCRRTHRSSCEVAEPVVEEGALIGYRGIEVEGVNYDVTFQDGSFNSLFGDERSLVFTTEASAKNAALALKDAIVDGPLGAFNSEPFLMNGCEHADTCQILITHGVDRTRDPVYALNVAYGNRYPYNSIGASNPPVDTDTHYNNGAVWSVWTVAEKTDCGSDALADSRAD